MTNKPQVRVELGDRFVRELKGLSRKYPRVRLDIQKLVRVLEGGETPGNQVRGVGYPAYKVRVRSSDLQRGKSGGFRVIYYIRTPDLVVLAKLYPKTEREDISSEEIRRIIEDYTPPAE